MGHTQYKKIYILFCQICLIIGLARGEEEEGRLVIAQTLGDLKQRRVLGGWVGGLMCVFDSAIICLSVGNGENFVRRHLDTENYTQSRLDKRPKILSMRNAALALAFVCVCVCFPVTGK